MFTEEVRTKKRDEVSAFFMRTDDEYLQGKTARDTRNFLEIFQELLSKSSSDVLVDEIREKALKIFQKRFARAPMIERQPQCYQG